MRIGIIVWLISLLLVALLAWSQPAPADQTAKLSAACVELTNQARSTCDGFAQVIQLTPDNHAAQCAYDYDNADDIFRCMGLGLK